MIRGLTQRIHSTFDKGLSYDACLLDDIGDFFVHVELIASPINPADMNMIEGSYLIQPDCPCILGNECVGRVVAIGSKVTSLSVGDRVIHPFQGKDNWIGFWRDAWICHEDDCFVIPDFIDNYQAAMFTINPMTAYMMLTQFVSLEKGDVIIQNLASSAVGRWVVFLARLMGVRTINVVRNDSAIDDLYALGATEVIVSEGRFSETLGSRYSIKLALNGVGGLSAKECAKCLSDYGTMVTYGAMGREPITLGNGLFIFKRLTLTGFNRTSWVMESSRDYVRSCYQFLFDLLAGQTCIIPVRYSFLLSQFEDAFQCYLDESQRGKVLFVSSKL